MAEAVEILKKYWKHNSFRKPQEEIINSVLTGNDTMALLPTGGGKSVCYQVPGMVMPGITLVISPLIALIKDQVENLQKKDIKAIALLGGISQDEISNLLDNCKFGNYKFLYLSPERLQQDWIVERIKELPINLIAIDEAHCVSQWGNDFRPAYLQIKKLKEFFPKVPFLAVTASATNRVQKDIIKLLELQNPAIFKKSFYRENIGYHIIQTESKLSKLITILKKNPESAIIYVRNRKNTVELSQQLSSLGFKTAYYHGGLTFKGKEKSRNLWMQNEVQVIIATNAFGMGIDKPDVKTVVHYQLPENLENYYQEVGRAGRNEQKAFGILLTNLVEINTTKETFKSQEITLDFLKEVYKKLNNYFQIAYGEGFNQQFAFSLNAFCSQYKIPVLKTYNTIQFLDRQGIITLTNENTEKVKLQFIISSKEVIRYCSINTDEAEVIATILRTYSGIFEMEMAINPVLIAKKAQTSEQKVLDVLKNLEAKEVVTAFFSTIDSLILFNEVREDDLTINRISKYLEQQNKNKQKQFESLLHFIEDDKNCKSELLLNYFDEEISKPCGICSYCISRDNQDDVSQISLQILEILKEKPMTAVEIEEMLNTQKEILIFAIQILLEKGKISCNKNQYYLL